MLHQIPACQECGAQHTDLRWRDIPYMGGVLMAVLCDACYNTLLARANQAASEEKTVNDETTKPELTPDELRLVQATLERYLLWLRDLNTQNIARDLTDTVALRFDREQAEAAQEIINRELNKE